MADDAAAPAGQLGVPIRGEPEGQLDTVDVGAGSGEILDDAADYDAEADDVEAATNVGTPISAQRLALLMVLVTVVALAGLVGWLGFRTHESHRADEQRKLFLQAGRQGAINLTTIDFAEADADIQRILASATGTFYDDFSKRSQPFVDVVKKTQSKSVGTVTEAGLESVSGDHAQVLVAVSVKASSAGAAEQQPRAWRMRISVQQVGVQVKVSDVEFVP
jgi:Mce-associated membrane protein